MPDKPINGREPNFSEDDMQSEKLAPRGMPGKESPAKITPQPAWNYYDIYIRRFAHCGRQPAAFVLPLYILEL